MGRVVEKASAETPVLKGQLGKCGPDAKWQRRPGLTRLRTAFLLSSSFSRLFPGSSVPGCSSFPLREQATSLSVGDMEQVRGRGFCEASVHEAVGADGVPPGQCQSWVTECLGFEGTLKVI